MNLIELVKLATEIERIEGIHYLFLYYLYDLAVRNPDIKEYTQSYKNLFNISNTEHIFGIWKLDYLFEDLAKNKAELSDCAKLLLANSRRVTDWDRYALSIFAEISDDQRSALAYSKHLSRSSDIEDIKACLHTLYKNEMHCQIYQFVSSFKRKDNYLSVILKELFVFLIQNNANGASILFDFPLTNTEELELEQYLIEDCNNKELLLLFYIKRKKSQEALNLYNQIAEFKDCTLVFLNL
jgi:hypothetical protein